jgi:hypothetical protein
MSKKVRQLVFCLFASAVLAAPAAQAFDFSYTQSGVGSTMAKACNNAIQKIDDYCEAYGPITTDPGSCVPLWGINGEFLGYVCTCEATTAYCRKFIGGPFN